MIIFKKGESLIEVLLAMTIFSLASVSTVAAINYSLFTAQADLEITQARNELDTQAEALRFIQTNYAANKTRNDSETGERYKNIYTDIWQAIKDPALQNSASSNPSIYTEGSFIAPTYSICSSAYDSADTQHFIGNYHAFAINPRIMSIPTTDPSGQPLSGATRADAIISTYQTADPSYFNPAFQTSSTYPRFIYSNGSVITDEELLDGSSASVSTFMQYTTAANIEGLWVYGIPSSNYIDTEPEYIDYYINSCWYPQGIGHAQTISTTIRLYNPDANEISVTEKPAFWINYYYRDRTDGWKTVKVLTRASVTNGIYTVDIKDAPEGLIESGGSMFAGWMPATEEEGTRFKNCSTSECIENEYLAFKSMYLNTNTFAGNFCEDPDNSGFHPECKFNKLTTGAEDEVNHIGHVDTITTVGDAGHIDLVMVEKPPMDIAVIFDTSDSMKEELKGAQNGLLNLSAAVLGNTIGKMSLTTIYGDNTVTEDCKLGYHDLGGTCGEKNSGVFRFNAAIKNTTPGYGPAPEYRMMDTVRRKANELAAPSTVNTSYEPAYNKIIILVTDTIPTQGTDLNTKNAIASLAASNRIRVYIIQSYRNGEKIGGEDVGSDGYDNYGVQATVSRVNDIWGSITSRSGGAIIPATKALGTYTPASTSCDRWGHCTTTGEASFAGSSFRYDYNFGKLCITPSGGSETCYGN